MKFTADTTELQRALGRVGGVIPSKSPTPILEDFLFDLSGNNLTITATDLEVSFTTSMDVKGKTDGSIAIPAKRMIDTVRALPADSNPVIASDQSRNKVMITTKNGEFNLSGEDAKEFPSIPAFKAGEEVDVDCSELRKIIQHTTFAVSTDELRPAMMGVLFESKGNELRAVSTDGHRLVRYTRRLASKGSLKRNIIVPAKALQILSKTLEGGSATIGISEKFIRFAFGRNVILSRLIDETYPSYESVIPTDNEMVMSVNRELILSALRRVALYSSASNHHIRLGLKEGTLTVRAQDVDFGGEAHETVPCSYNGGEMEIGFNAHYVVEMLTHLEAETVSFRFSSPTRAGLLVPDAENGSDVLMLVMPVRLTN
ncbi:MAG: DNA polymerase III subunit beta [Ignavibacteria bacterium]|nr:DNA polymerase III subunit beta [Ignavibacteria bacterium]